MVVLFNSFEGYSLQMFGEVVEPYDADPHSTKFYLFHSFQVSVHHLNFLISVFVPLLKEFGAFFPVFFIYFLFFNLYDLNFLLSFIRNSLLRLLDVQNVVFELYLGAVLGVNVDIQFQIFKFFN